MEMLFIYLCIIEILLICSYLLDCHFVLADCALNNTVLKSFSLANPNATQSDLETITYGFYSVNTLFDFCSCFFFFFFQKKVHK